MNLSVYAKDFSALFFPAYCAGCHRSLVKGEESICLYCQSRLPRTAMHDERGNKLERLFWGRTDIEAATAFLKMPREGTVHRLIHELKYKENKSVGIRLGKLFGTELVSSQRMNQYDYIIPVPLHPKKLYLRGYNQCDCIAEGLSHTLGSEMLTDHLRRIVFTQSQTRKSRYDRWKNVETIFGVRNPEILEGKRVLLIDDVITTGSTIEACSNVLNQIRGLRLSVASLAMPV
ncbi:MAG: ComF family protein [Flavobacteriales bacterium]|nr:ComF family protein [Flavobacteriales bacterium]